MSIGKAKLTVLAMAVAALAGTYADEHRIELVNCDQRFSAKPFKVDANVKAADSDEIVVKGEGAVSCDPELMVIELEVSATDPDMATSRRLFGEKSAAAIAAFQKAGVSTNEITTSGMTVYADSDHDWRTNKRTFLGYKTMAKFKAVLPVEIERCERIYAAIVASCAGEGLDVSFELRPETQEKASREARRRAVEDAKSLAEELCGYIDRDLGSVKRLTYGDFDCDGDRCSYANYEIKPSDKALVAVSLKKIDVQAAVKVVYALQ